MAVKVLAEFAGRRLIRVEKSRMRTPKKGVKVQAGDLLKAMLDPAEMAEQAARAPKPRIMIETMRVVSDNCLTAQDHALYEVLLAWARRHGLDKDMHEVPADAIRAYLGTANWSDIVRSMERLSTVQVQYDFRDTEWRRHGRIALVNVGFKESLKDSRAKFVEFEIPARIRRLMVEARDYALLELGAFPRFRCKYTAIMYQRLALRAGYDPNLIRPWEIEPVKLAEVLGYPMRGGVLRMGEFRARCLEPMLDDIAIAVERFGVRLKERRGTGRGSPVEMLIWHVSPAKKELRELPMAPVPDPDKPVLKAMHADELHAPDLMPAVATIRKLATKLSVRPGELAAAWVAALDEALHGIAWPDTKAPLEGVDLAGDDLATWIERAGPQSAFIAWAPGNVRTKRLTTRNGVGVTQYRLARGDADLMPPETAPEETPEEKRDRLRVSGAEFMIRGLDTNPGPGLLVDYFADDMDPWLLVFPSLPNGGAQFRKALATVEEEIRAAIKAKDSALSLIARNHRSTAYNLARAARDGDFARIAKISTAILASAKATPVVEDCPF